MQQQPPPAPPRPAPPRQPCRSWKFRSFLRDGGKLRVKERYYRRAATATAASASASGGGGAREGGVGGRRRRRRRVAAVLPDGRTWRVYLRVLSKLISDEDGCDDAGDCESINNRGGRLSYRWILLESAAELLDYRNQSPVVLKAAAGEGEGSDGETRRREAAAAQERSTLLKLVERHRHSHANANVDVLCDLSVRCGGDDCGEDEDEWDWLGYDRMGVEERCRNALIRAGRIVLEGGVGGFEGGNDDDDHDDSVETSPPDEVVLIVSDAEHMRDIRENIRLEDGIRASTIEEFVDEIFSSSSSAKNDDIIPGDGEGNEQANNSKKKSSLLELVRACQEEYDRKNGINQPTEQEDAALLELQEQIQVGLRNRTLLKGRLEVTRDNPKEAFVSVSSGGVGMGGGSHQHQHHGTYFVDKQRGHFNRAFHQDVVILQPLPQSQWGRPVGRRRLVHHKDDDDDDDDDDQGSEDLLGSGDLDAVPSARVVAIAEPSRRTFVATVVDAPSSSRKDRDSSHLLAVPMDVRVPKIRVAARRNYVNVRLKVRVDGWEAGNNYPHGRVVDVLGPIGDLETELAALLHENQIDLTPFSPAALSCLPRDGPEWKVSQSEIDSRLDLRASRQIFSVDPPGCQDIDDTMHAHELPNGDIEFGVHIADVTHFVRHNSPLDKEAQMRGTTFYLVDRRFDMLPSLLSSNLCSLHGGTDRLAVSVIWTLSPDMKDVKSCWYGRSVIHNCAAMTYDQADNILEGRSPEEIGAAPPPPLTAGSPVDPALVGSLKTALLILTRLARKRREDREAIGGSVDLSSGDAGTELKFTLVDGKPTKVMPKTDKEIHHTIAEMMILANTYVATKIFKTFPDSALLRRHRSVEEDRFSDLREMLEAGGISLTGASNFELANALKDAQRRTHGNSTVNALFRSLATRAMSEAQYICTGDSDGNDGIGFSHYGLGLEYYTHFTSPIRRYADVVVHKQLMMALHNEQEPIGSNFSFVVEPSQNAPRVSVPESNVVSIMGGEGLVDSGDDGDDILDALIEGASELALGSAPLAEEKSQDGVEALPPPRVQRREDRKPYRTAEVTRICQGLNLHTRLAKYSSMECQRLFLSLYFRQNVEVASAVVVNLRSNGFWAYVPKFDMRLPVFLKDMSDQIQIDPALLGLPKDSGLQPTLGFSASICRRFPSGKCDLIKSPDDERLEVFTPEARKRFTIRPLEVLTVQLTCDNWDVRARVPSPRAQLISSARASGSSSNQRPDITSEQLKHREDASSSRDDAFINTENQPPQSPISIFEVVSSLRILPTIEPELLSTRTEKRSPSDREVTIVGRFGFGGFKNPDTRIAVQQVAQQMAAAEAAQRRQKVQEQAARRNEYDVTKSIERSTMARQQRLAAEKRNTRRIKAK